MENKSIIDLDLIKLSQSKKVSHQVYKFQEQKEVRTTGKMKQRLEQFDTSASSGQSQTKSQSGQFQIVLPSHYLESKQRLTNYSNISSTFPLDNNPTSEFISSFNYQLENGDFSYFRNRWIQYHDKIIQNISFVLQNWNIFKSEYQKPLENFIHIVDAKICDNEFWQQIYPGLSKLINKIQKKLEVKASKRKIKPTEKNTDELYHHYVCQIESRCKREGAYYIKHDKNQNKLPIGEFIAQCQNFTSSHTWKEIFQIAEIAKKKIFFQNFEKDNKQWKNNQQYEDIAKELQNKKQFNEIVMAKNNQSMISPPINKICCMPFFYYNMDISDKFVNQCPILVGKKLADMKERQPNQQQISELDQLALDIIALLNAGGGVILFNTFKSYLEIWPKGESILESEEKQYLTLIQKTINNIHPRISQQIIMSFVPVVKNPFTFGIQQNKNHQRNYIAGLYVLRIVVKPKIFDQIYYFSKNFIKVYSAIIEKEKRKIINGKQLYRLMKKKFNYFYVPLQDENDQQMISFFQPKSQYFYDHQSCLEPEKGQKKQIKIQDYSTQNSKLESKYKYITLLVTNKANHPAIKQRLAQRGIQVEIVRKYDQYRFKTTNNSAAMFHNVRFDQLLQEVAYKKEFQFNGRYILTILVTPYIKLIDKTEKREVMPQDQFKSLQKWLQTQHKKQKLKVWAYKRQQQQIGKNGKLKQQTQYYLQTQSKMSTLFMYFVMIHYGEKVVFKNPPNLQKLKDEQRKQRWVLLYPRN